MLYGWLCLCSQAACTDRAAAQLLTAMLGQRVPGGGGGGWLCATQVSQKRERVLLGECKMGVGWVRFVSPDLEHLFVCLN